MDVDRVRWHLAQARKNAQAAMDGRARFGKDWAADPVTLAGLTKLVEVAAEYMDNIPLEIQAKHHRVPWRAMAGRPNLSSREYHRIDPEILEHTITVDLPELVVQIDQMLALIHS